MFISRLGRMDILLENLLLIIDFKTMTISGLNIFHSKDYNRCIIKI